MPQTLTNVPGLEYLDTTPVGNCYQFERYKRTVEGDAILTGAVGAAFVITMPSATDRHADIAQQLGALCPTDVVFIVINKGYKCDKKTLCVKQSNYDLFHANVTVFEFADTHFPGEPVLVLEDDFTWARDAAKGLAHVREFVLEPVVRPFDSYFLGALPIPMGAWPTLCWRHWRAYQVRTTHAVIRTPSGMAKMRSLYKDACAGGSSAHIDEISSSLMSFMYYRPLAYQTFPPTDNQQTWKSNSRLSLIQMINLHRQPEPGTTIMYACSIGIPVYLAVAALVSLALIVYLVVQRVRGEW